MATDFDSPWKEALEYFLKAFLEFFFPKIHDEIDWARGYESLDKELERILPESQTGKRFADKLFRVWRKNGEEAWVLIHIEVQAQKDAEFPLRMYTYHYRIFDRYGQPVVSLAVLADENPDWRPAEFGYNLWGCSIQLKFPVVKLQDYSDDLPALENHSNPFGLVVAAHLQSQATRNDPAKRQTAKIQLMKRLLDRGWSAEDIRQLFRFVDWLLKLPLELEQQVAQEIYRYQKEKKMTYISSIERWAMEEGRQQGREQGRRQELLDTIELLLQKRLGEEGPKLYAIVTEIAELDRLRSIQHALVADEGLEKVQQLIQNLE